MTIERAPSNQKAARSLRRIIPSGLLLLTLAAGCEPASDEPTDTPDMGSTADMMLPPVETELKPTLVPVSTTGHDRFLGVAYEPGGSFYASGLVADSTSAMADNKMVVAKFTAAGELDKSFGTGGFAIKNVAVGTDGELARGIVVQSDGKIVVVGPVEHAGGPAGDRDVALVRFNKDGSLDTTFGTAGVAIHDLSVGELVGSAWVADTAWGLTVYPDNRLLVHGAQKRTGGTDTDFAVVRLTADGARDMTFGTMGVVTLDIGNRSASPRTTTLLPDGNIIASGYMSDGNVVKPVIFKLSSTGQLDRSFATNGIFNTAVLAATTEVYAAELQGTSLVTTGYGRNAATESLDWVSLRITAAGQLDTTYGTDGYVRLDLAGFADNSRSLAVLPDNRILLVGGGRTSMTDSDGMIALLTPNGQKDTKFSSTGFKRFDFGGTSDFFWGAAVSPDKTKVAIVGTKSSGVDTGQEDGAVLVMPMPK